MNKNEKIHDGMAPDLNTGIELNDDEMDTVSGGISNEDLQAWWSTGNSGAPICTRHFNRSVAMKSYWKDGKVHLECPECGNIKVLS